jgi:hypothetical protein
VPWDRVPEERDTENSGDLQSVTPDNSAEYLPPVLEDSKQGQVENQRVGKNRAQCFHRARTTVFPPAGAKNLENLRFTG